MTKDDVYEYGQEFGFYYTCVSVANIFTIILNFIWGAYITYRTIFYLINRIICPILNIQRNERNCGCNNCFAKQDEFLNAEDHTFRERGIRIIACVHLPGFIFAFVLLLSFGFEYYSNTVLCSIQAGLEQLCIWIQLLMFINYYLWLFIEVFCCMDLEDDERSEFARKRVEIQKRYRKSGEHSSIFDNFKDHRSGNDAENERILDNKNNSNINFSISDTDTEEEENQEITSPLGIHFSDNKENNQDLIIIKGNIFSRCYQELWKGDKYCFNSFSLCCVEICCCVWILIIVLIMVLVPALIGEYDPNTNSEANIKKMKPKWCWIQNFWMQVAFWYAELFFAMILIPILSILIWMRFIWFCVCVKGKKVSEDPAIRAIGVKVGVYSFVFVLWMVSFVHRLAYFIQGGERGYVIVLAGLQELQMGSYTGVMIIAFFVINFITMYCDSIISCGVCACWSDIKKWTKKRRIWLGEHKFTNKRIKGTGIKLGASVCSIVFTELRKTDVEMMYIDDI